MEDNMALSRMLFSELYKIVVNKVTFVGFKGGDRPNRPLRIRPCVFDVNDWVQGNSSRAMQ